MAGDVFRNLRKLLIACFLVVLAWIALPVLGGAQQQNLENYDVSPSASPQSISGVITDPSGAVLPSVTIQASCGRFREQAQTDSWAFVVGATGVMNTLSTPLFGLWRAQTLPSLLAPYRGKPVPTQFSSVNAAFQTAQDALPGMEVTGIVFPNPILSSPRHYVIWTKGKTAVTSRLFTPALVDVESGRLTTAKGLPWYLRVLEVSRPLHFGDYGGTPFKVLWALFDLALILVLVSGIYLWLSRRKTPVEKELDRLVNLEELPQAIPEAGVLAQ